MADETTNAPESQGEGSAAEAKPTEPQGTETDWEAEAKKWEKRAKASHKNELRLQKLIDDSKPDPKQEPRESSGDDAEARLERLQAENDRLKAEAKRGELVRSIAREVGVDPDLLIRFRSESEDDIRADAEDLAKALKTRWPKVTDNGAGSTPRMSKKQILEIENQSERVKAIAKNPDLFK